MVNPLEGHWVLYCPLLGVLPGKAKKDGLPWRGRYLGRLILQLLREAVLDHARLNAAAAVAAAGDATAGCTAAGVNNGVGAVAVGVSIELQALNSEEVVGWYERNDFHKVPGLSFGGAVDKEENTQYMRWSGMIGTLDGSGEL